MKEENKDVIDYAGIGDRIRKERKKRGMSIKEIAPKIGILENNLSCIELGTRNAGLLSLVLIANYLGVSLDYLVYGERKDPTEDDQFILSVIKDSDPTMKKHIAFILMEMMKMKDDLEKG